MKTRRRSIVMVVAVVLLLATVGVTAAMITPTADELLAQSLTSLESVSQAHVIFDASAKLPEEDLSATVEVWGRQDVGPNGEPALRLEVLASSEADLAGMIAVSNGTTFWLYSPERDAVVVGQAEEMGPLLADKMEERSNDWRYDRVPQIDETQIPETPEEAVAKLLEYVSAERDGQDVMAEANAYRIQLIPIPEQMPEEFRLAGGIFTLWLRVSDQLPMAFEYAKGAFGEVRIEATFLDVETNLGAEVFEFDIPDGVEVIDAAEMLANYEPQGQPTTPEFEMLVPSELPAGAAASDRQLVGGAVVQRYNLPDGQSFFVAQGAAFPVDAPADATGAETVAVRGAEGTLYASDDETRTLLSWQEGDLFFVVGGDLTPDQAMAIAESLQ